MECKTNGDKRSLGDLVKELRDETTTLLRQEVELAKTEMSEKARSYVRNSISIAAGAIVAFAGFLFLLLAVNRVVTIWLAEAGLETAALWLAPLIVGGVVAIIGYALVQKGISTLKNESPAPSRTMHSIKEDKKWLTSKLT
jgi:xanthine/uracil permease